MNNDPCSACGFSPSRRTTDSAQMVLDCSFPSQNEIGANDKGAAGHKYRRTKARLRKALTAACPRLEDLAADGARRITITRLYAKRKRMYDRANLIGGSKPLVDLLVEYGILKNDNAAWFEGVYKQGPSDTGKDMIKLEIEDFDDITLDTEEDDETAHQLKKQFPEYTDVAFDIRYDSGPKVDHVYPDNHDRVLVAAKPLTPQAARVRLVARAMSLGLVRVGEVFETGKYWCLRVRHRAKEIQ